MFCYVLLCFICLAMFCCVLLCFAFAIALLCVAMLLLCFVTCCFALLCFAMFSIRFTMCCYVFAVLCYVFDMFCYVFLCVSPVLQPCGASLWQDLVYKHSDMYKMSYARYNIPYLNSRPYALYGRPNLPPPKKYIFD